MKKLLCLATTILFGSLTCQAMKAVIVPVTDEIREPLREFVYSIYHDEGCGICHKEGAEVGWFSPHSRCAHKECYNTILPALKSTNEILDRAFHDTDNHMKANNAHINLVLRVQHCIGEQTILEYAQQKGLPQLKDLFDLMVRPAILHILQNKSAWKH